MRKKLWMLCWGLAVMVTAIAVNVSPVAAEGLVIVDSSEFGDEDWMPSSTGIETSELPTRDYDKQFAYLRGVYRIAEVYQTGLIRPEDVGAVIKITSYVSVGYSFSYNGETGEYIDGDDYHRIYLAGNLVSAPANTRMARALEYLEAEKAKAKAEWEGKPLDDGDPDSYAYTVFRSFDTQNGKITVHVNPINFRDDDFRAFWIESGDRINICDYDYYNGRYIPLFALERI